MPAMNAASAEYTVVLRSRSGARVRPGYYIDLAEFPDGLGGRTHVRVSTRWEDLDLGHPIPRELWIAVRTGAPDMDAAVRSAAAAASAVAMVISFCVNAAVEPPELHVAFNSAQGLSRREFMEAFTPDETGQPGFGRWVDTDSLFAFGQALYASSEAPRLFRALAQYQAALRYWNTGSRVLVLSHLYIACESLTKAVQRIQQVRLGLTEPEHARRLGVNTDKKNWETLAEAFARREYIFKGNRQVYQAARAASNQFEHGTADLGNVRQAADNVTSELFDLVRSAMLTLMSGLDEGILEILMSKRPLDVSPLYKQVTGYIVSDAPSDPASLGLAGELFPTLRWQSRIKSATLQDDNLAFEPEETFTVQFAPGLRFEPRDFAIYSGLNPTSGDLKVSRPPGWGPDDGTVREAAAAGQILELDKPDLLPRVAALVNAASDSVTSTALAFPRPFAYSLFRQGIAFFESAHLLLTDSRPVEALPLLHGLVTIAARFEQMTEDRHGLGIMVRLVLDAFAKESPGRNASLIDSFTTQLLQNASNTGLTVPGTVLSADATSIWQSLSDEMRLARQAMDGSYLMTGLHIQQNPSQGRAGFHTRLESGPFTDVISTACAIGQLDLLQHAAPLFGWTIDHDAIDDLLTQARLLNEASASESFSS